MEGSGMTYVKAGGRMVPRLGKGKGRNRPTQVILSAETLRLLEAWRAEQPGLPGKSEAIRRIVETTLARWEKGKASK